MPDVIADIRNELGGFGLTFKVRDTQRLVELLRSGQLDLALGAEPAHTAELTVLGRWSFNNVCLLPDSHPLHLQDGPVDLAELGDMPLITFEDQYLATIAPDRHSLEQLKARSEISVSTSFAGAVLVKRGLGMALIDPFTAAYFAATGNVSVKRLKQELPYEVTLLTPQHAGGRLASHFQDRLIVALDQLQAREGLV